MRGGACTSRGAIRRGDAEALRKTRRRHFRRRAEEAEKHHLCGVANPGCRRLSGGAFDIGRARPPPTFRRRNQPCLHRIVLDILPNAFKFVVGSHQMVVALILPERLAATPQHSICFMRGKSLQGPQPSRRLDVRCHQKMNVIRHDHKGVHSIAMEPLLPIAQACQDQRGDFRHAQIQGPRSGLVEDSIDCYECFSAG